MEAQIRNVAMLKGLSPDAVRSLAAAASRVTLQSDQILFREGDPTGGVFVVEDGHISITRKGTPIAELGPGQMFGEMASLDGGPRVVTITASEPTTLIAIPSEAYNKAVYGNLAVLSEVLKVVLSRVRGLEEALQRS